MARPLRHQINAAICALVVAHAVYRFAAGQPETATALWTALVVAQAVLGVVGVVWFWRRARQTTG
jgi:hypothetical protein